MKKKPRFGVPMHLRGREIIGKGKHRTVIALGRNRAIKVENDSFLFRRSPNALEWENYRRYFANAPAALRRFFVRLSRPKVVDGHRMHQTRMVRDFDGAVSQQLKQAGPVKNAHFWKCFHSILAWMLRENIPFYDFTPKNILVKKLSATKWIPVIIDYETTGPRSVPFQLLLHFNFFSRMKVRRRAERLMRQYQLN